jgi:hypothetical protein
MRTPGFNADASLVRSGRTYGAGEYVNRSATAAVSAAQLDHCRSTDGGSSCYCPCGCIAGASSCECLSCTV